MVDYAGKLRAEKVLIKNSESFNRKIAHILDGGTEKLQCVFDFDATISKAWHNGEKAASCHRALEMILPKATKEHMDHLNEKFMKIEFDPSLSKEEKRPHMVTWWSTAHENMVKAKLNNKDLDDAVKKSGIILRNGEADFFQFIKEKSLPVLLFSAGITQIVQDVVSNNMIFDESDGNLVSFSEPLIHTFSKTTASIGEEWKKTLESRPNVILMGDSHGDPDMVKDEDTPGSCLRIGFLNHHPEKNREIYENLYDIVLVSDESLSVPIEIFKILCNV